MRFKRASRLAGSALLAGTLALGACEKTRKPELFRCYDAQAETIRVYSGTKEKGSEKIVRTKNLGTPPLQPLSVFCNNEGFLFLVDRDYVRIRRLLLKNGRISGKKVLDAKHTSASEYLEKEVAVIDADIWSNPSAGWKEITVATLTNTGLIQLSTYSHEGEADNDFNTAIYDLGLLPEPRRWPKNVSGGVVRLLGRDEISVIPLGKKGSAQVDRFYHIRFLGEGLLIERRMSIHTMRPPAENVENIFEISRPVRFDRQHGGWIVDLVGEQESGKTINIYPMLRPEGIE